MRVKEENVRVLPTGICFYSERHEDHAAIATINKEGEISSAWINLNEHKKEKYRITFFHLLLFVIYSIALILFFFCYAYLFNACTSFIWILRLFILLLPFLVIYLCSVTTIIELFLSNRIKSFRAIKNMIKNGYNEKDEIPTLENFQKYSYYCNDSTMNVILLIFLFCIASFIITYIPNIQFYAWLLLSLLCSVVIFHFIIRPGKLDFMQGIFVNSPTDSELKTAIAGLKVLAEHEQKPNQK